MTLKSIKPTLLIGLGTQGRKVLTDFKHELYANFGDLPAIKILAIDFKEDFLAEEKEKAIIENYFSIHVGKDLLDVWMQKVSSGLKMKKESFLQEYKLKQENLKELINNILKKPDGTIINITIDEKAYEKYDVEKFKTAIQENAEKINTAGMAKIEKLIDSNFTSINQEILNAFREEIKPSKLVDKNTFEFLEGLEKSCKETGTIINQEIEKLDRQYKMQNAQWNKTLEETITESALPMYRKRLIEALDKKLNFTVQLKACSALLKLFSLTETAIEEKFSEVKRRRSLINYLEKRLEEEIKKISIDETLTLYIDQKRYYEKLKARIKSILEKFEEQVMPEWFELNNQEAFYTKIAQFCRKFFIPSDREYGDMMPSPVTIELVGDELFLLEKEFPHDMEKRSFTWGEYKNWALSEIKKMKTRDASPEDLKEAKRFMARSLFWANIPEISTKIEQKLREVTLISNRKILNEKGFELVEANDFDVFLVSPLYDSVGSGIFIDMAYLTEDRIIYNHGTSNPFAFLLVPGPIEQEKFGKNEVLSNSFAALSELDYYLKGKDFKKFYYPGLHEVEIAEKPFKMVFLVDYINTQGFALQSVSERNQMCKEMLMAMILSPLGANLKAHPELTASLQRKVFGKNTAYASFGISLLKFPAPLVRKYSACLLGEKILTGIYIREDFNKDKLEQTGEGFKDKLSSSLEGVFIPSSPKLDRKQFEQFDLSDVCNHIKIETGLLESRFSEQTEKAFSKELRENLEKIQKELKENIESLSTDTESGLRSAHSFVEKIYNDIKVKREDISKKYKYTSDMVKEDEKRHFKTFDNLQAVINSFKIPVIGIVIPPQRINLLGYLSLTPVLLIAIATVLLPPLAILFVYLAPLGWYIWYWKRYFDKYFETRDALFNHIDKKILNRGKLISFDFKLKLLDKLEPYCYEWKNNIKINIKKLSDIGRDLKEEAEDTKEEIFIYRGALTSLLITDRDLDVYRKDSDKDLPLEGRSLYEALGSWEDSAPVLRDKIRKFLWDRYSYIEETLADEILKSQENSLDKIEENLKMTFPFWTVDEIILAQSRNREKIYFCGLKNSEASFLAAGLKQKPNLSGVACFNLTDPHSIFLGQVETGMPLFALKVFSQMKKAYSYLSAQHLFRAIEDVTGEPFPIKMTPLYNQIRRIYLPATLLDIYKPPAGLVDEEIYENLAENPEILSIIEEKLQKIIIDDGKDKIKEKLLDIIGEKPLSPPDREFIQDYMKNM